MKSERDYSVLIFWLVTAVVFGTLFSLDKLYQYHHIKCQNTEFQTGEIDRNCVRGTGQQLSRVLVRQAPCEVTLCTDGSCSDSTGRGTCSYHGGEDILHSGI